MAPCVECTGTCKNWYDQDVDCQTATQLCDYCVTVTPNPGYEGYLYASGSPFGVGLIIYPTRVSGGHCPVDCVATTGIVDAFPHEGPQPSITYNPGCTYGDAAACGGCVYRPGPGGVQNSNDGLWGICCIPRSVMIRQHPGASGCTVMTGQHCCAHLGGTWHPSEPWNTTLCTQTGCPSLSCCGCDWCCDQVTDAACKATRTYAWENLPEPHTSECIGTNKDQCPVTPQKPVCRYVEFAIGKRPAAHEPPESGWHTGQRGRHELVSVAPVRAIDRAPENEECRTFYANTGKGDRQGGRHIGWLCGQHNWRVSSTKTANRCYPSKRPDGRHSFNCHYRVPCPEKPTVCL